MMIRNGSALLAAVAGVAAAVLTAPAAAAGTVPPATAYRVVDLGVLPGATYSFATAVNDRGVVVGESGTRAVLWQDGRIVDLDVRAGVSSTAVDVNDRGEVIGDLTDGAGNRAFRWSAGQGTVLPPLPGDRSSFATAINERGEVLGNSSGDGGLRAVLWRPDGRTVDLTARTGLAVIADLDDSGRFVGGVAPDGMNTLPALWSEGRTTVLTGTPGIASAINRAGAVTGYHHTGVTPGSFTWEGGRLTAVPLLPGMDEWSFMHAQAITARGLVVGTAGGGGFAWDGRTATALPGLNGNGTRARDADGHGAIVGSSGTTPDGLDEHAVLLLPRR